ncbi:MAG: hypothetical protein AB9882_06955 [Ignavibacteriaceae bacterium]
MKKFDYKSHPFCHRFAIVLLSFSSSKSDGKKKSRSFRESVIDKWIIEVGDKLDSIENQLLSTSAAV